MIAFSLLMKRVGIENVTTTSGRLYGLREYKGNEWIFTKNISYNKGYAIHSLGNDTITIKGFYPPSTNIHLSKGWNLVGYPSLAERLIEDVFEGIEDKVAIIIYKKNGIDYINIQNQSIKKQKLTDKYREAKQLKVLKPGCSYFIYLFEPVIWRIEN